MLCCGVLSARLTGYFNIIKIHTLTTKESIVSSSIFFWTTHDLMTIQEVTQHHFHSFHNPKEKKIQKIFDSSASSLFIKDFINPFIR